MLIYMGFKKPEAEQIVNIIEDKDKLKRTLYKFETDCKDLSELNNPAKRQEFLDIFQLVLNRRSKISCSSDVRRLVH